MVYYTTDQFFEELDEGKISCKRVKLFDKSPREKICKSNWLENIFFFGRMGSFNVRGCARDLAEFLPFRDMSLGEKYQVVNHNIYSLLVAVEDYSIYLTWESLKRKLP